MYIYRTILDEYVIAPDLIKQLGSATEESISRLQKSLEEALPYALGIFEKSPYEKITLARLPLAAAK